MKTRYVYYNKETGFIEEILSKRKKGRAPYIECDHSEVEGFIMGTKSINRYVIAYNKAIDKNILIERNNVVVFRKQSKELYKIPYKKNTQSDITLVCYEDGVMEISLDMSGISPLFNTNFGEQVKFERGTEIRIVVKETDEFVEEIVIDAQKLLEEGQMFFKMKNENIEFYTYKLFNSYSWFKGTKRYTSPVKRKSNFNIYRADMKILSTNYSYHLIMKPTQSGVIVENNIENLTLIKFNEKLNFFIVDRHDPNILYEKFSLSEKDLKRKNILVDLETEVKGKSIMYDNKYVSVFLEG